MICPTILDSFKIHFNILANLQCRIRLLKRNFHTKLPYHTFSTSFRCPDVKHFPMSNIFGHSTQKRLFFLFLIHWRFLVTHIKIIAHRVHSINFQCLSFHRHIHSFMTSSDPNMNKFHFYEESFFAYTLYSHVLGTQHRTIDKWK